MFWNGIELLEGEEWKDIDGFEGIYAISNYGRIASCNNKKWGLRKLTNSKKDYFRIVLIGKNKKTTVYVHRLVAIAFIDNSNGYNYVHHIDGDKQNNNASNLMWISKKDHHMLHLKENPHLIDGMNNYNKRIKTKTIYQFDVNGEYIADYENGKEASIATGVCHRNILQVASKKKVTKGRRMYTAGGYIWSYDKEIDLDEWYNGYTL